MQIEEEKIPTSLWQTKEEFISEFNRAIEEEQFILHLLPKYHMGTENIYGAEVLSRWDHPQKGLLWPKDFLPLCEAYECMCKLDYYVWEHACKLLADWKEQGYQSCTLSVKVSKWSLYHGKIGQWLSQLLDRYQVSKEVFQVEIEEDSIRADIYQAKEAIGYLHDLGFTILLDDFSYGCSSISALNQIEVDILKVDLKFFSSYENAGKGEAILASIIKSVNWLGMEVLAECVETKQQNQFAKAQGCHYVQGFFFSKPLSVDAFDEQYLYGSSQNTEPKNTRAERNEPTHNLNVLIVDDAEMERALLEKYLEKDFHIQLCESAEKGLDYLKENKNHIDLILVDYMMPDMNGIEFLQFCQLDKRLREIPKIMITSNEEVTNQSKAFAAGAFDYLLKPLLPELVQVRVHHALELNHKIQSIQQEKQEYLQQAQMDKATGIWNKITFQSSVEHHLKTEKRGENALLIIDIDDFKLVNDTQGHLMGDEVIKLIAAELSSGFRSSDYVGRFGGDEFTVYMMKASNRELVKQKAADLITHIKHKSMEELGLEISVSIGIGFSKSTDRFDELFERTDAALYQAKKAGKGKYEYEK